MQRIAEELNITGCWVCGGSQMTEQWPWRGEGLTLEQILLWNQTHTSLKEKRPEGWVLSHEVIGQICIAREGNKFTKYMGHVPCKLVYTTNSTKGKGTWWPRPPEGYWTLSWDGNCIGNNITQLCWKNQTEANPFTEINELQGFQENPGNTSVSWKSPDGLFWICGKRAYHELPKKWRGTCTIGIIQTAFFLLPKQKGDLLGVPL